MNLATTYLLYAVARWGRLSLFFHCIPLLSKPKGGTTSCGISCFIAHKWSPITRMVLYYHFFLVLTRIFPILFHLVRVPASYPPYDIACLHVWSTFTFDFLHFHFGRHGTLLSLLSVERQPPSRFQECFLLIPALVPSFWLFTVLFLHPGAFPDS